jgi:hypothetical protein
MSRGTKGMSIEVHPTPKQTCAASPTLRLLSFCFIAGFFRKTVGHFSGTCLAASTIAAIQLNGGA